MAFVVAAAAGQIRYPDACFVGLSGARLYTEGLY
jgi:hypothetical protein